MGKEVNKYVYHYKVRYNDENGVSKRRDFLQPRRYKKNLISVRLHYTTTREGNIKNTEEILAS